MSLDLAPDGKTLFFDLLGDLYSLPVTGGRAQPILRGAAFESQPRVAPTGAAIAYVSDASGSDNVWVANVDGSNPRQLTQYRRGLMISPAWSPDGAWVYATVVVGRTAELWRFRVQGDSAERVVQNNNGPPSPLVSSPAPGPYGAALTSDGRWLYYAAVTPRPYGSRQGATSRLVQRELANGRESPVQVEEPIAMKPALSNDGRWLVYAAQSRGRTGLRARDLSLGTERWLLHPIDRNELEARASRDVVPTFAISADSRTMYATRGGEIWAVDLTSGDERRVPFEAPVELALAPAPPAFAPLDTGAVEGRIAQHIAIGPNGSVAFGMFAAVHVQASGDGQARQLTPSGVRAFMPAWSPDGRWIAYVTWDTHGGQVWKVSAGGGTPVRLSLTPGWYVDPVWLPSGNKIAVVRGSVGLARRSPTGIPGDASVVTIDTGGRIVSSLGASTGARKLHLSADTGRLYFTDGEGLGSISLAGGDRRIEARAPAAVGGAIPVTTDFRLSPDGKWIAAARGDQLVVVPASLGSGQPIDLRQGQVVSTAAPGTFAWALDNSLGYATGATMRRWRSGAVQASIPLRVTRARPTGAGSILLMNATAITMRGAQVIRRADILVTDARITAIGPSGSIRAPVGARRLDLSGKFVIPGLVDVHAHGQPRRELLEPEHPMFAANFAYGVTTIRDPQTTPEVFAYADLIASGAVAGPRVLSTGPGVFQETNFASYQEAEAYLRRYRDEYKTWYIKSYLVGSRLQQQWVARAARALGMLATTEGGADTKLDLTHAIDGFSGNEHALPTAPLYEDATRLIAQSGIAYTPTLLVAFGGAFPIFPLLATRRPFADAKLQHFWPPEELYERTGSRLLAFPNEDFNYKEIAASAAEIQRAGGNVAVGGHGEMQGWQAHWEMELLVEGGMRPLEALRAATQGGAQALGLLRQLGTLEPGKVADLVVLDRDPLVDIRNSTSTRFVMREGMLFEAATLDRVWPGDRVRHPPGWWRLETSGTSRGDADPPYDVVFRGGTVIDGTGTAGRRMDVAVAGDTIAAMAPTINASLGRRVLDVRGLTVTPGFIDNHAHLVNLAERPDAINLVRQGITSVMATLHSQDQPFPMANATAGATMAPNVGYFAGHTWIRKRVMGLDAREPTPSELNHMKALVDSAMQQGALGLATGLEYVPATYARAEEIIELAKVAARYGGSYATHLRDEGPNLLDAVAEAIRIGREAELPVLINHLKVTGAQHFGRTHEALTLVAQARARGQRVAVDVYPYTAFSTYGDILFPPWALEGGTQAFVARIANASTRARLVQEMIARFPEQAGSGPESIVFRDVPSDSTLAGRTLAAYLVRRGRPATVAEGVDAVIELQAKGGFIGVFHAMSDADVERIVRDSLSLFESDGDLIEFGRGFPHPRSYGSFPRILSRYVREKKILTIESAVAKMTSRAASWHGLVNRGVLRVGAYADIVAFDAARIGDRATYEAPHAYPVGMRYVMINGTFTIENGQTTGEHPGRALTRRP